jgi:outer membrane protein
MKQISLILNAILVIAVIHLYYINYKKNSTVTQGVSEDKTDSHVLIDPSTNPIVFVNSDSLIDNYEYLKKMKAELEARQEKSRKELSTSMQKLEKEIQDYQEKAQGMSPAIRQITEEGLMKKQQSLYKKRDELAEELGAEEEKVQDKLQEHITSYLKEYNQTKNYHYILGYSRGSGILLANDSLDITKEIIDGLNKQYSENKKK